MPSTRDILAMVGALLSPGALGSGAALKDAEAMLATLDAMTPKTPKPILDAMGPALKHLAVHNPVEQLLARVLECLDQSGWTLEQRWPTEVSEFGGAQMLFAQARVSTGEDEKLRIGLRLLAKSSPNQVGAAFLTLELGWDNDGNGLLPGQQDLVLLKELGKFAVIDTSLKELEVAPDLEQRLATHYGHEVSQAMADWPAAQMTALLDNALSA
jgi:hypothetical protein